MTVPAVPGTAVPGELAPLLLALQFADSSFPSGLYTLSHGLEGLVQTGVLVPGRGAEAATVAALSSLIRSAVGPVDAAAVALTHPLCAVVHAMTCTTAHLGEVDARVQAAQLSREVREASVRTGRQVLDLAAELLDHPVLHAWAEHVAARRSPGTLPVAMGVVYACGGLSRRQAVATDLAATVAGAAGAALRLRLLDHRGAQRAITALALVITEVTETALATPLAELGGFAPVLDLAACHHEDADARLFAS